VETSAGSGQGGTRPREEERIMQPTSDPNPEPTRDDAWQVPLEADPADAQEQGRPLVDADLDPEASVTGVAASGLDLDRASEADLVEQLDELPLDDDLDR
jgi:hypothetical protein